MGGGEDKGGRERDEGQEGAEGKRAKIEEGLQGGGSK